VIQMSLFDDDIKFKGGMIIVKVYVILDTDHLSRPWRFIGITLSKRRARELQRQVYAVKEYPLFTLLRKFHKVHT